MPLKPRPSRPKNLLRRPSNEIDVDSSVAYEDAIRWYQLASEKGDTDAIEFIESLAAELGLNVLVSRYKSRLISSITDITLGSF